MIKNKKLEIINSAITVIAKYGFAASPVALIAKEAEISVGLIYRYFSSKDELIITIYKDLLLDIDLILDEKYFKNKPLKKQIKKRWSGVFNYLCENPLKANFLKEFNSSIYLKTVKNDICKFCSFSDLIEKNSVKRELKKINEDLIVDFFIGTLFIAFSKVLEDDINDKKSIEESMFSMFWDGIKN
jgi:AcrR family transcriptional regulator